jgi:hypothetical protein
MKQIAKCIGLLMITFFSLHAMAQDLGDADLSFLSGQSKFNIEYKYDKMMVGDITEDDYKKEKMDKMNAKSAGKGDRWWEKWVNARALAYEPKFEDLLNRYLQKENKDWMAARNMKDAKYTIVLKTLMTEPGFQAVVMKKNPYCKYQVDWVDNGTKKTVATAEFRANGVLLGGSDFDFDPTNSIVECYAKAGKEVGKAMAKKMK